MDTGLVGIGIVGRLMAAHLGGGGHTLFVHDVGPTPSDLDPTG